MLYKETVEREIFQLLNTLMGDDKLSTFSLTGGTALALYLGHRKSIDIDLFTSQSFNAGELEKHLSSTYNFQSDYLHKNTLKGEIGGIKLDCITHDYPYVRDIQIYNDIRIYSMEDIAAMKLSAIADNGSRLKDFIDISYLSTKISLNQMLKAYTLKYPNSSPLRPIKGLTYYEDINFNEPILLLRGKYKWVSIAKRLHDMINKPDHVYLTFPD